jgi:hypothetical protein
MPAFAARNIDAIQSDENKTLYAWLQKNLSGRRNKPPFYTA